MEFLSQLPSFFLCLVSCFESLFILFFLILLEYFQTFPGKMKETDQDLLKQRIILIPDGFLNT